SISCVSHLPTRLPIAVPLCASIWVGMRRPMRALPRGNRPRWVAMRRYGVRRKADTLSAIIICLIYSFWTYGLRAPIWAPLDRRDGLRAPPSVGFVASALPAGAQVCWGDAALSDAAAPPRPQPGGAAFS